MVGIWKQMNSGKGFLFYFQDACTVNCYLRANFSVQSPVSGSCQNPGSSVATARLCFRGTLSTEFMLKMCQGKGTLKLFFKKKDL